MRAVRSPAGHPSTPHRALPALGMVVVLAFLLRLAPLALPFEFSGPDTASYEVPAAHLAAGLGLTDEAGRPAAARPPGYPVFLALIYALAGGPSWTLVRGVQAALGAACALVVHRALLARAGPRAALLGAALVAFDPVAIGQSPFLLREQLLQTLTTLLVAALLGRGGRWRHLQAGLLLAALALTHQLYVLLGPCLAAVDLLAARSARARLLRLARWAAVGLLVAVAVLLWARRNERATGHLTLTLATNPVPARELWLSATYDTWWLSGDFESGFQARAWAEEDELVARLGLEGAKAEMYRRTFALWRAHPLRTLGRVLRLNLWYWVEIPGAVRLAGHPRLWIARWAILPWHWLRLGGALMGLGWLLRGGRWRGAAPVLGALAFFALAPAPLYPVPRYLGPAIPLLCWLAALCWSGGPRPAILPGEEPRA